MSVNEVRKQAAGLREVIPTSHGARSRNLNNRARRPLNGSTDGLLLLLLCITALGIAKVLMHDAHVLEGEYHSVEHTGRAVLPIDNRDVSAILKFIGAEGSTDGDVPIASKLIGGHDNTVDTTGKASVGSVATNPLESVKSTDSNGDDGINPQTQLLPLKEILSKAYGGGKIKEETIAALPSVDDVSRLYGSDGPIIYGTETCAKFRENIPLKRRIIAPAGIFNTGTNLMSSLLRNNCVLPHETNPKNGVNWHVPWGKHNPVSWRFHNVAQSAGKGVEQGDVLPIVTIKDPYTWFSSMCRHPYAANWPHNKICPNLIDQDGKEVPVRIRYGPKSDGTVDYTSLAGVWNTWYKNYMTVDFPRLIVRFEDILFRPEEVIGVACKCAGGTFRPDEGKKFRYMTDSAKGTTGAHSGATAGLESALLLYTSSEKRTLNYSKRDLEQSRKSLDKDIMNFFHYADP